MTRVCLPIFLSGEIALAFARHYPERGLDCEQLWRLPLDQQRRFDWLSWGNSWMLRHCSWRRALQQLLNLRLATAIVSYLNPSLAVTQQLLDLRLLLRLHLLA